MAKAYPFDPKKNYLNSKFLTVSFQRKVGKANPALPHPVRNTDIRMQG
jgi:hypothetical protein